MNQTASTPVNVQFTYSLDDETYCNGRFDSKQAAITDAVKEYDPEPGAKIFVGEAETPSLASMISADDVIDEMACRADDIGGEHAENFPDITLEDKERLELLLVDFFTPLCSVPFYTVKNVKEHVITLADLELAAVAIESDLDNDKC